MKILTCIIYRTPTATATINSVLKPTIELKITGFFDFFSEPAVTSAYIGQNLIMYGIITEAALRSTYIVKV